MTRAPYEPVAAATSHSAADPADLILFVRLDLERQTTLNSPASAALC